MTKLGREDWVEAADEELAEGGIDAVRVEVLARRLGVTKGSFYWHFAGRDDLLDTVLARFEALRTDAVIEQVESVADEPVARLRALTELVFSPSGSGDRGEPAIRAWASSDPRAAATLARVDRRRVRYVADLLVAAGLERAVARRRSQLLYRTLIGDFVWRAHGGEPLDRATRREVVSLLLP
ncbi:TetR/AcrR family transcriptional regulator [Nitriliruptor alkaliphilus]|uniref:TetR/AcrR family transcriptional regulator n=1 Tax=Nitriliruptor alkaliphilus TaxID=427918 RepID=UPI0006991F86|nr:TetR/AcrR family transcriptional regulator [Nitriliruptor alkaliphilus]